MTDPTQAPDPLAGLEACIQEWEDHGFLVGAVEECAPLFASLRQQMEAQRRTIIRLVEIACKFNCDAEDSACRCAAHRLFRGDSSVD